MNLKYRFIKLPQTCGCIFAHKIKQKDSGEVGMADQKVVWIHASPDCLATVHDVEVEPQ